MIHLPGQITSVECNVGAAEGRDVPGRGRPASLRPAGLAHAHVEVKQPTPTPGEDQERPGEGGSQMATSLGQPTPLGRPLSWVLVWKLRSTATFAYH